VGLFFFKKARIAMAIIVKSLSASTVSQYVNCSQRVYWEKVEHLPKKGGMNSKQLFGVAMHSAVATYFRGLLNNVKFDLDRLVRCFKIRYESWPANDLADNEHSIDELCSEAKGLLQMFLDSKPPTNVVGIEMPIKFALTSTLDCIGQVDLIVRDAENVLNVIEVKTSSKTPAQDQIAKYAEQCLTYSMKFREPCKAKAWLFLRRKKAPEFQQLDLDIDSLEYEEVIEKFTGVAKALSTGIHFRNRSWQCGSCPYNYLCYREPKEVEQSYQEAA
jgi:CRISPR/Cas system-associated exonuclease Cas4 (RecB family)